MPMLRMVSESGATAQKCSRLIIQAGPVLVVGTRNETALPKLADAAAPFPRRQCVKRAVLRAANPSTVAALLFLICD
jgi:hypothetical protein